MEEIQFDDIESLQKHVSEEFGPFGSELEVTQEMINQFADVTGDHQWIHLDVERAKKESPFGTAVAHAFSRRCRVATERATASSATATRPTTAQTSCASSPRCPRDRRSTRTLAW